MTEAVSATQLHEREPRSRDGWQVWPAEEYRDPLRIVHDGKLERVTGLGEPKGNHWKNAFCAWHSLCVRDERGWIEEDVTLLHGELESLGARETFRGVEEGRDDLPSLRFHIDIRNVGLDLRVDILPKVGLGDEVAEGLTHMEVSREPGRLVAVNLRELAIGS